MDATVKPAPKGALKARLTPKDRAAAIGKWVWLLIIAVIQLFPLVWLVDFSFASSNELFTTGILIIPETIRWDNYAAAFTDGNFLLYLRNSLVINTLAVVLVLAISIMAAYGCARMRWKLSPLCAHPAAAGHDDSHPRHPAAKLCDLRPGGHH